MFWTPVCLLIPVSLWVEMKPPTPTSPLRCLIELRAGSVQDSDLGFSHRMARAFGALRAAPLLSRSAREDGRIGESAWRLRRVSLCWGSTLGRVKNLGLQAVCLGQNIGTPYHLGGEIRRSYNFRDSGLWSGPKTVERDVLLTSVWTQLSRCSSLLSTLMP